MKKLFLLLCVLVLLLNNNVFTQNIINVYVTPPITNPITGIKITPYSGISPAYLSNKIFITASPGEYEPASFTIKALDNIPNLVIGHSKLTKLTGTYGEIPSDSIDIKVVKCWWQASASTINTDGRFLIPELLLNNDSLVYIDNTDNYLRLLTGQAGKPLNNLTI